MAAQALPQNRFYVYLMFRWDGRPLYLGKGQKDRDKHHLRPSQLRLNTKKNNAIKKTLSILGEVPVIRIAENLTEDEAHELEKIFVSAIGRFPDGPLLNCTDGGEGRSNPSPETRQKMSISRRAIMSSEMRAKIGERSRNISDATRLKIGVASKGRPVSDETRKKLSLTSTGRRHRPESIELMRKNALGRIIPAETRVRMSEAALRRPPRGQDFSDKMSEILRSRDPEINARMAATLRGRKYPPERIEKARAARWGRK